MPAPACCFSFCPFSFPIGRVLYYAACIVENIIRATDVCFQCNLVCSFIEDSSFVFPAILPECHVVVYILALPVVVFFRTYHFWYDHSLEKSIKYAYCQKCRRCGQASRGYAPYHLAVGTPVFVAGQFAYTLKYLADSPAKHGKEQFQRYSFLHCLMFFYGFYIVSMSPVYFYHCMRKKDPFWDMRHLGQRWRISSPGMYAIPVGDRADENLSRFHGGGNLVQVVMCPIYGKGNAPRVNQSFLKTPLIGFFPDSIVLPWRRCGYRCVKVLSCVIRIGFFIDAAVKTPTAGEENSLCHRFCTLDKAS